MATAPEETTPKPELVEMASKRENLDRVLDRIRDRIVSGAYPVGFHLRESAVAGELRVSRTPVREALQRLAVEGLVDLYPNRGARVAAWSDNELEEIFGLRTLLESYAARLAASRIDPAGIVRLEELATRMETAVGAQRGPQLDKVASLNTEFHMVIFRATGNDRLASILLSLVHIPVVHRTFLKYSEADLRQSFAHHNELIAALRAHDAEWAEAVMRAHLLAARRVLIVENSSLLEAIAGGLD